MNNWLRSEDYDIWAFVTHKANQLQHAARPQTTRNHNTKESSALESQGMLKGRYNKTDTPL